MILEFIIGAFMTAISGLMQLFPKSLPAGVDAKISEALAYFLTALHKGDNFLPISTMFTILLLVIGLEITFFLFNLALFVYKRIRG